jgi:hypothetical protein
MIPLIKNSQDILFWVGILSLKLSKKKKIMWLIYFINIIDYFERMLRAIHSL